MREEDFIFSEKKIYCGEKLDHLLAMGFYRMQHVMFTTSHAHIDASPDPIDVFWIRTNLHTIKQSKKRREITKKCASFSVQLKPAVITPEIENLFAMYREMVPFSTSDTCRNYLHHDFIANPFDSKLIEIRDNQLLIAAGYFDAGKKAIAGILNFYHPAYRHYSLGKFLMLKKIEFALQQNMDWYYTGYISTQNSKFDYKIFPNEDCIEVFLPNEKTWEPFTIWNKTKLSKYIANSSNDYFIY